MGNVVTAYRIGMPRSGLFGTEVSMLNVALGGRVVHYTVLVRGARDLGPLTSCALSLKGDRVISLTYHPPINGQDVVTRDLSVSIRH